MAHRFEDTIFQKNRKALMITSRLSNGFMEGKHGVRYMISGGFGVDQEKPGLTKSITRYLEHQDKDYVIYRTQDGHGVSDNPEDYNGLVFEAWQEAMAMVLDYQPVKQTDKKYHMNILICPSLAGWLATNASKRGEPSARSIGACLLVAPAYNFLRTKTEGFIQTMLWAEGGPALITRLMEGQFLTSPNGHKINLPFAKSSEHFEVDLTATFPTDVPLIFYHGLQDELVDYRQSVEFAKKVESPIDPEVVLVPGAGHDFSGDANINLITGRLQALETHPELGSYYKSGLSWREWTIENVGPARRKKFTHNCGANPFGKVSEALQHANNCTYHQL